MSEETFLPPDISEYKQQTMSPIMKEFYDVLNPSKDVAQRFIGALREYLEYINDSPYSPAPGINFVPDHHRFQPVVIKEIQRTQKEYARIHKEYGLDPFS